MKGQKIVMLDQEILEKLRNNPGVNVSELVNEFLRNLPLEQGADLMSSVSIVPFQKERTALEEQVANIDIRMRNLGRQRREINARIQVVSGLIDKGTEMMTQMEKSRRIAKLFSEMNGVIRECNYDVELSWEISQGIISLLREAGRTEIDKAYFSKHIEMLKSMD